ncbi:MAG: hypothetical protein ACJ8CR_21165 [Roseiflexaceae bacterium]
MHRFRFIVLIIIALVLAACGGPPPDTTVPAPPKATALERSDNAKVNQFIDRLKAEVPAAMKEQGIKDTAEQPIEQQAYQSTAGLQEVADFYKALTQHGWSESNNMPLLRDGVLLDGYQISNTTLVINAVEETRLGGDSGVVIYTVKGTK